MDRAGAALIRWLDDVALPLWATTGADLVNGGFREELDDKGQPTAAPVRARVQARQAFVYGRAARREWPGPAETACLSGLQALRSRYRHADGLFSVLPGSARASLYDQTFVLLALSVSPHRKAALVEANALLDAIKTLRHPAGGFREANGQGFLANPHMHLFEAALALEEAGGGARWTALADEIAALALVSFIDPDGGFLREVFDADWRPMPGAEDHIEPGHQFEWAWLLERWARLRGDPEAAASARRLFDAGCAGVDHAGRVVNKVDASLAVTDPDIRLWPQTERLKAALIFSREDHTQSAIAAIQSHLDAAPAGQWAERQMAGQGFLPGFSPATSLYHLAVAIEELAKAG